MISASNEIAQALIDHAKPGPGKVVILNHASVADHLKEFATFRPEFLHWLVSGILDDIGDMATQLEWELWELPETRDVLAAKLRLCLAANLKDWSERT